eukprot:1195651-Prorocentrum_minimum.AAC.7
MASSMVGRMLPMVDSNEAPATTMIAKSSVTRAGCGVMGFVPAMATAVRETLPQIPRSIVTRLQQVVLCAHILPPGRRPLLPVAGPTSKFTSGIGLRLLSTKTPSWSTSSRRPSSRIRCRRPARRPSNASPNSHSTCGATRHARKIAEKHGRDASFSAGRMMTQDAVGRCRTLQDTSGPETVGHCRTL